MMNIKSKQLNSIDSKNLAGYCTTTLLINGSESKSNTHTHRVTNDSTNNRAVVFAQVCKVVNIANRAFPAPYQ
jgi:hypothetical protein